MPPFSLSLSQAERDLMVMLVSSLHCSKHPRQSTYKEDTFIPQAHGFQPWHNWQILLWADTTGNKEQSCSPKG